MADLANRLSVTEKSTNEIEVCYLTKEQKEKT
jgi:hypothetical protein